MISNWFRVSSLRATMAAGSLSLLLLCGCPAQQVPATPNQNENANTSTGNTDTDTGQIPRPIPPVDVDTTTTTGGSTDGGTGTGGSGGSTGGGGGGGGSGSVFLSVNAPTSLTKVRPGTAVPVGFNLSNPSGALSKAELIVARDANGDGAADAAPILVRQIATANGTNTTPLPTNDPTLTGALVNGFGRFVAGIRTTTVTGDVVDTYAAGGIVLDSVVPTSAWISPAGDNLLSREGTFQIQLNSADNAAHTVRVLLDRDATPESGNEFEFAATTTFAAGSATRTFSAALNSFPSGLYRFYVIVSDGIAPAVGYYAPNIATGTDVMLQITNRLVGDFDLSALTNNSNGAIFRGFNFNDLAGSSISRVADLNDDGRDEFVISSRYGKPGLIQNNGVGFGEAYIVYGSGDRLRGVRELNSVGRSVPGLIFSGIRTPRNATIVGQNESTRWTKGLSDLAVIPDMDGDNLPDIAFSFPRVESITLRETDPTIQHPEIVPDLAGMGNLEYTAFYGLPPSWHPNEAQFTRGGIVIVSSHNEMMTNPLALSRKSDRVLDLHEAGQLFNAMGRPGLVPFIRQVQPRNLIGPDAFGNPRSAKAQICADCNFQPPEGWSEGSLGEVNGVEDGINGELDCRDANGVLCPAGSCPPDYPGYPCNSDDPPDGFPFDPEDEQDTAENTPGQCGNDGCGFDTTDPPPPTDPYTGNIHDGREARIPRWFVQWDVVFNNQAPGGFHMPWTFPPADPPLVNPTAFPFGVDIPFPFTGTPINYPNLWYPDFCASSCEVTNEWFSYAPNFPCTTLVGNGSWDIGTAPDANPFQTPTDCYPNNPPGPFIVPPEEPCFDLPAELCPPPDVDVATLGASAWTGFYGWDLPFRQTLRAQPNVLNDTGEAFATSVGARILGQKVEDEFGSAVGVDGTWLYISAPNRTANDSPYETDVPSLPGARSRAGVIYQVRTNAALSPGGITRTQLWIEPGTREIPGPNPGDPPSTVNLAWPWVDAEIPDRADWSMPTPHTYLVESVGSLRGATRYTNINEATPAWANVVREGECPPAYTPPGTFQMQDMDLDTDGIQGSPATRCGAFLPYPVGTAGYYMERTPQIVGPHDDAQISFVRGLGDINDDGINDFAVGSEHIKQDVLGGAGPEVGGVFIVFSRTLSEQQAGDYLLEDLALDIGDSNRLRGVLLRGTADGETLGRVFDGAGDFNGDGIDDVIVGNEGANGGTGEAIVMLGSPFLVSPAGGWTVDQAVAAGEAVHIIGAAAGDLVGANVAGAGDVDGDGISDILVAAPGAAGGKGVVYLIYGDTSFGTTRTELRLSQIGTVNLPGARLIGRNIGDFLGAGAKTVQNTDPNGGSTTAVSRGVSRLGDIDGDGRGDFAIGAMLADPAGRTDGGEVYILYGRGD